MPIRFLCKRLIPGYLNGVRGEYAPPDGYFVAEREAIQGILRYGVTIEQEAFYAANERIGEYSETQSLCGKSDKD